MRAHTILKICTHNSSLLTRAAYKCVQTAALRATFSPPRAFLKGNAHPPRSEGFQIFYGSSTKARISLPHHKLLAMNHKIRTEDFSSYFNMRTLRTPTDSWNCFFSYIKDKNAHFSVTKAFIISLNPDSNISEFQG